MAQVKDALVLSGKATVALVSNKGTDADDPSDDTLQSTDSSAAAAGFIRVTSENGTVAYYALAINP